MAKAAKKHTSTERTSRRGTGRQSGRGSQNNPPKNAPAKWLSIIEDVFPRWRDHLESSTDAEDVLEAFLRDPETRSRKRRVDANGEEIPGTLDFPDAGFWRDYARLLLQPDSDGGPDTLEIHHNDPADVYLDFDFPGGHWEFDVQRRNVERWDRLYFPTIAAPLQAASKNKRRKAEQASRAGRPEKWDWEEGGLFLMQELRSKGSPRKKENQVEGWKSVSDAARLVIEHLSKDGEGPDFGTTRGKVTIWIEEFEAAEN